MSRWKFPAGRTLALLFTLLCSGKALAGGAQQMISPQRLAAMLKEGSSLWVVDVRGGAAFERRHIEGSLNIPLTQVGAKRFPAKKAIVLVDDSLGLKNAREAAEIMGGKGVERLLLLDGGLFGWQREGLPLSTREAHGAMPQVTPEELAWARKSGVALKIYDLRETPDREKYPVKEGIAPGGEGIAERLNKLKELLLQQQRQTLAKKLEKPVPAILVLPMHQDAREQVEHALFGIPGDLRYLDGGHAAWMANPERVVQTDPGNLYCADKKAQGEMK